MDYCHICGKYDNLSFEHIPPENALNKGPAKVYIGHAEYDKKYNMEWKLIYLERASTELPLPLYFKPISNIPDETTENR